MLSAYQRARDIAEHPRRTEYRLVSEITGAMLDARDRGLSGAAMMPALHRNRQLWGTFSSACAGPGNGLPPELRASIISLALWVDRFTSEVVAGREAIDPLIAVNRMLIEGLAPTANPAPESQAA